MVFGNTITDIDGAAAASVQPYAHSGPALATPRVAISLADQLIWQAVIAGNRCERVRSAVRDGGVASVVVCANAAKAACECR
jgi:hypothetical protein